VSFLLDLLLYFSCSGISMLLLAALGVSTFTISLVAVLGVV
jgi:hypothetical protein